MEHTEASFSLAEMDSGFWYSATESEIREMARQIAADRQGGVIELKTVHRAKNISVRFIYKRLQGHAYFFTGMFFVRTAGGPVVVASDFIESEMAHSRKCNGAVCLNCS